NTPLDVHYADFAHWQNLRLQGEALEKLIDYWQDELADCPQVHSLPLDFVRTADKTATGANHVSRVDADLALQIKTLGLNEGATLFMLLQSAFALFLGRWSYETDIVMGAPIAGRAQKSLESMIGLFLNTQVFRTRFDDNPSYLELLQRTLQSHLQSSDYNEVPFELLVERLNPERSLTHSPIFQIMINLNNTAIGETSGGESPFELLPIGGELNVENKYDLTLYINEVSNGIVFNWVYDGGLFKQQTISKMADEFNALLALLVANPQTPVLNHGWANTPGWVKPLPTTAPFNSLSQLFEAQVERAPQHLAVVVNDLNVDYQQLNQRINQLAWYLSELGVKTGDRIAIATTRSVNRVIAIFAVLKLGAAFVPLT
ncbi:MAG: condensation domain-containing protein, partial [Psychrosphaera sp.]|nr:condensation domain-containing protein [Psychrosphaera sp.]